MGSFIFSRKTKLRKQIVQAQNLFSNYQILQASNLLCSIIEADPNIEVRQFNGLGNIAEMASYSCDFVSWWDEKRSRKQISGSIYDCLSLCYLQLAKETNTTQFLQSASEWYEAMIRKYPKKKQLYYGLANIQFNLGHKDKAISNYKRYLRLDPSQKHILAYLIILDDQYLYMSLIQQCYAKLCNSKTNRQLGSENLEFEKTSDLMREKQTLIEIFKHLKKRMDIMEFVYQCMLEYRKQNLIQCYHQCQQQQQQDGLLNYRYGSKSLAKKQIEDYEKIIQNYCKDNFPIYRIQHFLKSLEPLKTAQQLFPIRGQLYLHFSYIYMRLYKRREAFKYAQYAFEVLGEELQPVRNLMHCLIATEQHNKVIEIMSQLQCENNTTFTQDDYCLEAVGFAYQQRKEYKQSYDYYYKAYLQNEESLIAKCNLNGMIALIRDLKGLGTQKFYSDDNFDQVCLDNPGNIQFLYLVSKALKDVNPQLEYYRNGLKEIGFGGLKQGEIEQCSLRYPPIGRVKIGSQK